MYQLRLQVVEYVGCSGVRAWLSDSQDDGTVVFIAEVLEQFFEPLDHSGDAFVDMFDTLERFAQRCSTNRRVASGVSSLSQG